MPPLSPMKVSRTNKPMCRHQQLIRLIRDNFEEVVQRFQVSTQLMNTPKTAKEDSSNQAMDEWVKEVPAECLYYMGVATLQELKRRHSGGNV